METFVALALSTHNKFELKDLKSKPNPWILNPTQTVSFSLGVSYGFFCLPFNELRTNFFVEKNNWCHISCKDYFSFTK